MKRDLRDATDVELLRLAGNSDAEAFRVLMDRHADRLFRLAASLVGNAADAEDVLQETLAGAYLGARKFEGRASVKTWMTRILVTQASRWQRDRRRRRLRHVEPPEAQICVEGGAAGTDAASDLHAALRTMSAEHREVLALREFEAMSYDEIAIVLGVPVGTVESRLHRARGELRQKLSAYMP